MALTAVAAGLPLLDLGGRAMAWVLGDTSMLVAEDYAPPVRDLAFPSYQMSLVNLTTGERQRRPELDNGVQFWLSPDRTRIAYLAPGLSMGLMDIASGDVTPVPNSLVTYPSEGIPSGAVRFTSDGSTVYWTNYDGGSTAWRADVETGALEKIAESDGLMTLGRGASHLLYVASPQADEIAVHVKDLRSGEDRMLLTYTNSVVPAGTPFDPAEPRDFEWRPAPTVSAPPTADVTPDATGAQAGDWQIVDYAFASSTVGWVVRTRALQQAGAPMQVLHTTDGGRTWTTEYESSSFVPWSIDAVDAQHAWIAGAADCKASGNAGSASCQGGVLSTSDGGATWRASTVPSVPFLTSVDFLDANTGWAGNARYIDHCVGDASTPGACPEPRTVQRTTDGGATWTTVYDQQYMQMAPLDDARARRDGGQHARRDTGRQYAAGRIAVRDHAGPRARDSRNINGVRRLRMAHVRNAEWRRRHRSGGPLSER
jgi:hypothetical protein